MLALGKINTLTVCAQHADQYFVDGGEQGEVLLSEPEASGYQIGETVNAFVYIDGKNQLQATTLKPKAQVDQVAWLKVVSVSRAGCFLDWGLPKDLLLPFSEQKGKQSEGRYCLVRLFLDEDNRIAASMVLDDFIQEQAFYYKAGQAVELMIADATDLGFKAIVDHQYWGVLYRDEVFQPLQKGQVLNGFVKTVREDHKLDLILTREKYGQKVEGAAGLVLEALQNNDGFLALSDKSDPQLIYAKLGVSKKVFKQAIGGLYKQQLIVIEDNGIRLIQGAA